ncbi:MAG: hypothetical protein LBK01_03025 [Burkholderiaceae bacterium]|jgi:hypothetical protein|nr:hypothetical protein [Burkholderiaceae bacterium]
MVNLILTNEEGRLSSFGRGIACVVAGHFPLPDNALLCQHVPGRLRSRVLSGTGTRIRKYNEASIIQDTNQS